MTTAEGRNTYHDVNVILTHYHILCDTYLGLGIFYVIIIYCGFIEFSKAMDLPWYPYIVLKDHLRYYSVKRIKYYQILGGNNDRVIMYFIDKLTDKD